MSNPEKRAIARQAAKAAKLEAARLAAENKQPIVTDNEGSENNTNTGGEEKPEVSNLPATQESGVVANDKGTIVLSVSTNVGQIDYNDTSATEPEHQSTSLSQFLIARMLKPYGISTVAGQKMKSKSLTLNGFDAKLKLPKPLQNQRGIYTEPYNAYAQRCKPAIALWLEQLMHNGTMDVQEIYNTRIVLNIVEPTKKEEVKA